MGVESVGHLRKMGSEWTRTIKQHKSPMEMLTMQLKSPGFGKAGWGLTLCFLQNTVLRSLCDPAAFSSCSHPLQCLSGQRNWSVWKYLHQIQKNLEKRTIVSVPANLQISAVRAGDKTKHQERSNCLSQKVKSVNSIFMQLCTVDLFLFFKFFFPSNILFPQLSVSAYKFWGTVALIHCGFDLTQMSFLLLVSFCLLCILVCSGCHTKIPQTG